MKLTLSNVKELKRASTNPLTKHVCNYVIDRWGDYDNKRYIFTDVLDHGCQFTAMPPRARILNSLMRKSNAPSKNLLLSFCQTVFMLLPFGGVTPFLKLFCACAVAAKICRNKLESVCCAAGFHSKLFDVKALAPNEKLP